MVKWETFTILPTRTGVERVGEMETIYNSPHNAGSFVLHVHAKSVEHLESASKHQTLSGSLATRLSFSLRQCPAGAPLGMTL